MLSNHFYGSLMKTGGGILLRDQNNTISAFGRQYEGLLSISHTEQPHPTADPAATPPINTDLAANCGRNLASSSQVEMNPASR